MAMIAAPGVTRFVGAGGFEDALAVSDEMERICVTHNPNWTIPTWDFKGACLGIDIRKWWPRASPRSSTPASRTSAPASVRWARARCALLSAALRRRSRPIARSWNRVATQGCARLEDAVSSYVLEHVGERASGYVHSVFATSFNVALDGFLFHVGDSRHPLSCCGANVAPDRLAAMLARCRSGDRAIVKRRVLRVYDVAGTWELDLGALEEQSLSIASPVARGRLAALEGAVAALGVEDLIGLRGTHGSRRSCGRWSVPTRLKTTCAGRWGFLLGRGPGLTPSGDDVLVGYGGGPVALRRCRGVRAGRARGAALANHRRERLVPGGRGRGVLPTRGTASWRRRRL